MRRRLWLLLSVVAIMTASFAVASGSLAARPAPVGAYPDLRAVVPQKVQLVNQQQHEWLRFSNGIANTGTGP